MVRWFNYKYLTMSNVKLFTMYTSLQEFDEMKNGYYKDKYGNQEWRKNGKLHREDGPAIIYAHGSQEWWVNGKLHREDGPAFILPDGTQEWYLNGKIHREDGPAYIGADGTQAWRLNGKRHREDGPAIILPDGYQEWYINGKDVTDEVYEWFKEYKLTYETMDEEERMIFGFHIRSLM